MQRAQGVAPLKQRGGWRTMKAIPLRANAWQGGHPRRSAALPRGPWSLPDAPCQRLWLANSPDSNPGKAARYIVALRCMQCIALQCNAGRVGWLQRCNAATLFPDPLSLVGMGEKCLTSP